MAFLLLRATAALSALALLASAGEIRGLKKAIQSDIDTSKPARSFKNEYEVGCSYEQKTVLDQTSDIDFGTVKMEQKMHMEMDGVLDVSEVSEPVGGRQIDMTLTHIDLSVSAGEGEGEGDVTTMEFDSDGPDDEDVNPAFEPLKELIGHPMTIVLDADMNVVEASEREELLKAMNGNNGGGGGGGGGGQDDIADLASPKQFQQMSRMAQAVPRGEDLAPGDKWDFDDLQMDVGMEYTGTGELVGYRGYEGREVAVVALEGNFDVDLDKIEDLMAGGEGNGDNGEMAEAIEEAGMSILGGRMTATLYWDPEERLVCAYELTQSMKMKMTNPMDGSDVEIPVEQVIHGSVEKVGEGTEE